MNYKSFTQGFTLIELLVVIAIIGILAAVVIGSLNDARDGGQDASIKQSISNARTQAELIYNQNGYSYANVCVANNTIDRLMVAAAANRSETTTKTAVMVLATPSAATAVTCHSTAAGYAIIAPVNVNAVAGTPDSFCVDSTGFAGIVAVGALGASDITCR